MTSKQNHILLSLTRSFASHARAAEAVSAVTSRYFLPRTNSAITVMSLGVFLALLLKVWRTRNVSQCLTLRWRSCWTPHTVILMKSTHQNNAIAIHLTAIWPSMLKICVQEYICIYVDASTFIICYYGIISGLYSLWGWSLLISQIIYRILLPAMHTR